MTTPANGTGPPGAPSPISSAELRARARETFDLLTAGTTPPASRQRYYGVPDDEIIAEIPAGVGLMLLFTHGRGQCGVQAFRCGPENRAIPLVPMTRIPDLVLPAFGGAVARALDIVGSERKRWRNAKRNAGPGQKPVSGSGTATHAPVAGAASDPSAGGHITKEGDADPLPEWAGGGSPQKQGETP